MVFARNKMENCKFILLVMPRMGSRFLHHLWLITNNILNIKTTTLLCSCLVIRESQYLAGWGDMAFWRKCAMGSGLWAPDQAQRLSFPAACLLIQKESSQPLVPECYHAPCWDNNGQSLIRSAPMMVSLQSNRAVTKAHSCVCLTSF